MCLIPVVDVIQVATEDILVYKIVTKDNLSIIHRLPYKPNERYELALPLLIVYDYNDSYNGSQVNEGFHAYTSLAAAAGSALKLNLSINAKFIGQFKIVTFTIPKDAHYIIGDDGDIVSDAIVSGDLDDLGLHLESE